MRHMACEENLILKHTTWNKYASWKAGALIILIRVKVAYHE